jgi:uncharacterized NAD-dependent epimerase/dehydratase family protein
MPDLLAGQRLILLTDGHLDPYQAKTAVGILRYRPEQVAGVLDARYAGQSLKKMVGVGEGIPIVGTTEEALALKPTALLLGLVTPSGNLPETWRTLIRTFLERGLNVINGLHRFLADDPDFAPLADHYGGKIIDLRRPPRDLGVSVNTASDQPGLRVLTVGTDCNIGKKVTALELTRTARAAGWDAQFVATGQTGIAISGRGIALDAVISDFIAGAAERLVLDNKGHEVLFIEGQGAITHPGFSGVTLGLLHGTAPQALILCHHATRRIMRACPTPTPVPSPSQVRSLYEMLGRALFPCDTVALSVNTSDLPEEEARRMIENLEREMGLPATDPVRFGVDRILDALEPLRAQTRTAAIPTPSDPDTLSRSALDS